MDLAKGRQGAQQMRIVRSETAAMCRRPAVTQIELACVDPAYHNAKVTVIVNGTHLQTGNAVLSLWVIAKNVKSVPVPRLRLVDQDQF